jgi:sec-independent protein translocase protein TatB
MFDFAWTEIALIGVVALVAIGPKDMPGAIKAVAEMVKKARRMAGEFQTHVDEMVREANLDEVRSQISQIRNMDIKGTIERAVDGDGSIRKTFAEDPMHVAPATPTPTTEVAVEASEAIAFAGDPAPSEASAVEPVAADAPPVNYGRRSMDRPSGLDSARGDDEALIVAKAAPAFIPPAIASPPTPPAFIPPGTRHGGHRLSA